MYKKIIEFRPSISSENVGDHIIQNYITEIMNDIFDEHLTVTMPTRSKLTKANYNHLNSADYKFVCGTNLLASNMRTRKQWNLSIEDAFKLQDVILFGAGWWQYQKEPDTYTKWLLKSILNPKILHSVRDSYTEQQLRAAGINNVINTACPTMWSLTEEKCERIPRRKADSVVTTLTNYMNNDELDSWLLEVLLKNYKKVYVWLQAIEDYEQLKRLGFDKRVEIVAPTMSAYDEVLEGEVDYIGTRLHGGIHALNKERRCLIIAVDNRAVEISKDTNLPVIPREDIVEKLEMKINESSEIKISLPIDNINLWKSQFIK